MGGGEYDHRKWLAPGAPVTVSGGGNALKDALVDRAGTTVVIEVTDSATYDLPADLALGAGESLTIQASAAGAWPHLKAVAGELAVRTKGEGASLTLCGLLVEGGVVVTDDLDRLRLIHTTLVPGRSVVQGDAAVPQGPSLEVRPAGDGGVPINTRLEVQVAFSITGALRMPSHVAGLWLLDSIVAGVLKPGETPGVAIADAAGRSGPPAHIERSTVLGSARLLKLPMASESIFTGDVQVEQRQQGCVRFCFVSRPPASRTPPRYRCQPELEIARELERRRAGGATLLPAEADALADAIAGWLVPAFASDQYGDPEFGQLALSCPVQVRAGAEDGSEMGAFCVLKQPQREANLRLRLDEYLPIGLEAGIIYVTREHRSG
jgi:hypothetical protein